ncbi:T9SS type A sorting domain-containing protein [Pedobacter sp. ASV28]|uniref:T9SS type A sorting domain-containing protein n=1 Tax=Pedobacter sp. ASV28 TaxID=2795123 RepID=UPI0018EAEF93|nr:T9SS type A sorting domain-containing protein [Pedobacter sp. ASV28]
MKKRVLFFACLCTLFSLGAKAQAVQLYRTSSESAAATEWTYTTSSGGDKITYPASLSTSTSNLCGLAGRRVQLNSFVLTVKSTSISTITIMAQSSGGTSSRYLGTIKVNGIELERDVDFTTTSTIYGQDCSTSSLVISGLSIPKNTEGTNIELTFVANANGTGSLQNINLSVITLTTNSSLPLDLLSFSAKPDAMGKTVNISWKTANEVNTQDFVVERRSDDTEFKAIEVVQSKNITGTHNYTYIDKNPLAGTSYYRLKQTDINGEFTYSAIVDVKLKGLSLSLHPNPVGNELVVNHEYVQKTAAVKVVGLDGKSLLQTNSSIGTTSTIVNVSALPKGTYVLVYDANGKPQSQKFIKK